MITHSMVCYVFERDGKRVFLAQNHYSPKGADVSIYIPSHQKYIGFCDDFGPLNLASVTTFVEDFDTFIKESLSATVIYISGDGAREFSNAAFLMGAYMILKLKITSFDVGKRFEALDKGLFEPYRDATYSVPDFGLELIDCWRGLERGMEYEWLACPTIDCPQLWGQIDIEEYAQYDNPINGDLHEVVPGKFIAFMGPKDLGGKLYRDDTTRGTRHFSPAYYIDIFRELGVSTVVRLNEAHYNSRTFTDAGIEHHDLYFDDCTAPPSALVARFFRIVAAAPGVVAVHCKAGLGRTGTLIALYLMRKHGFTAREAMGWLRIVRPGSVIGEQQHYLCEIERRLRERNGHPRQDFEGCTAGNGSVLEALKSASQFRTRARRSSAAAAAMAAQVADGSLRRSAARALLPDRAPSNSFPLLPGQVPENLNDPVVAPAVAVAAAAAETPMAPLRKLGAEMLRPAAAPVRAFRLQSMLPHIAGMRAVGA